MPDFVKRARELNEQTVADRRCIHQFAGTQFDVEETRDYITARLDKLGIEWEEIVKCGIKARVGKGEPVFLLRADYDALPFKEQSGLPFASTKDSCHACGHDIHSSMLLCAAQMLKEVEDQLKGTIILDFQPAEEGGGGCQKMVDAGLLENPKVDKAMAIHVATGTDISTTGTIHYSLGPAFSSGTGISIKIKGKGGHGAQPHTAVDPITAAAEVIVALQHILSMEIAQGSRVALTFGQINGGSAPNVITDTVEFKGTLRVYDKAVGEFIRGRIVDIATNVAKAMRCEAEVNLTKAGLPVINDPELCREIFPWVEEVTGEGGTLLCDYPTSFGGEDFAVVTDRVPGLVLKLGAGSIAEGHTVAIHNPKVVFEEDCIPVGAAAYANVAFKWLENNAK